MNDSISNVCKYIDYILHIVNIALTHKLLMCVHSNCLLIICGTKGRRPKTRNIVNFVKLYSQCTYLFTAKYKCERLKHQGRNENMY